MKLTLFYIGRLAMLLGMFELLVDVLTAGPMGPDPKLFGIGIAIFVAGWGLTRVTR